MSSADGYRREKISFDRAIGMAGETLGELPVICKTGAEEIRYL